MDHRNFSHTRNFKQPGNNFRGGPMRRPRHQFNQGSYPPYLRPPVAMTPEALLMPSHMQAPPMFGPRGATIPPRMMGEYQRRPLNFQRAAPPKNINGHVDDFWCETCDRSFKSLEILEKHKAEHQKCGIDGCQFIAHPNVVTKHIQMQHSSGLYNKIRNISTPEDIANWIKERKKNYPSKENIEKRRAQQKECHDRGEKLQPNKSRFNNSRKKNDAKPYNRDNKGNKYRDKPTISNIKKDKTRDPQKISNKNTISAEREKSDDVDELYCNLKKFKGTSELIRHDLTFDNEPPVVDDGIDIEDDEWDEPAVKQNTITSNSSVCSALGNLINAYDTSSDDESSPKILNETATEKPILATINSNISIVSTVSTILTSSMTTVNENEKTNTMQEHTHVDTVFNENDSGPEETNIEKINNTPILNTNQRQGRKRKHSRGISDKQNEEIENMQKKNENIFKKLNGQQNLTKKIHNSLLEKLLENDIRHERNVILQCVHHVIQNNFFIKKVILH